MGLLDWDEIRKLIAAQQSGNQQPYSISPVSYMRVSSQEPEDMFKMAAKNLNAEISGENFPGGYFAKGRVGTYLPLSDDTGLSVGASGISQKYGEFKQTKPTGVDLTYTSGQNEFGIDYSQLSPLQKLLMLRYSRSF